LEALTTKLCGVGGAVMLPSLNYMMAPQRPQQRLCSGFAAYSRFLIA